MSLGIIGRKIGMTRVYDASGKITPVTVIAAEGNTLLQRKTLERDGYNAVQLGFHAQKKQRVTKALLGHFEKAGSEPKKVVREFRLADGAGEGELNFGVTQFQVGEYVDVSGRSKGKGFMGVVRKHNFDGQGAAHGSKTHRRNGSIGCRSTPGRIWKNQGMPGHMGDRNCTTQNLVVEQVREADNVLLISGAIPGAKGCYVEVRPALKKLGKIREAAKAPVTTAPGAAPAGKKPAAKKK